MIPHALDVEKVAVAMAAAVGHRFEVLEPDDRIGLRRYAAAAILRLGLDARTTGKAALAETLEAAAKAAESTVAAADKADGQIGEASLRDLQASVEGLRIAARVLLALPEVASAAPPPKATPAAPVEEAV